MLTNAKLLMMTASAIQLCLFHQETLEKQLRLSHMTLRIEATSTLSIMCGNPSTSFSLVVSFGGNKTLDF